MKIAPYLLHLYPRAFRERYEEEVLAMLEQRPLSWPDGLDLLFGAVDAHLHPELGASGLSAQEKLRRMTCVLRSCLLTMFCAYIGFILAGGAFEKMTESADLAEVARTNSLVGLSFHLVVLGAFTALLAVLVGSLPIVVSVITSARAHKRWGPLLGLAVPLLAFGVFLGTLVVLETVSHPGKHLLRAGQVFFPTGILSWVLITAAVASAGAICFTVTHSEIPGKLFRFAVPPFTLATISMGLICAAIILWGLGLHNSAPQLFTGNDGLMGSSTTGTWLEIVLAEISVCVVASASLLRARRARSALREART